MNKTRRIIARGLLTIPAMLSIPSKLNVPPIIPGKAITISTRSVVTMLNGKSRCRTALSTGTGLITAHIPRTTSRLKIFEPTTLLKAISFAP